MVFLVIGRDFWDEGGRGIWILVCGGGIDSISWFIFGV
jgi:hypothetical protein